jgi:O-antigen/teichoic acid export membrane protein
MIKQQLGRLAKNSLIYGVGQVLNRFISFLLLPLFTSYLTPTDYGVISILGLVVFALTPVFSLGFGTATGICYFEGNNQERKETTIWTAFILLVGSTSVLAFFGIVFGRQISWVAFLTADHHYLVTLSLLSTALSILVTPLTLYLQFEEKVKTFVMLTTVSTLISIGVSVMMVVVLEKGVQGLIEGRVIAQAIALALYLLPVVPRLKYRFSWRLGRELMRLGVPLIPSFASLFILQQMNRYFLQWFGGLDVVGVYSIGYNIGLVMGLIVTGFTNAWYPYFMSFVDKKDEARILFGRILTYYVFGFGMISLLFYAAAKPVVMIMTQPEFHEAYKVVGLSATAQFLIGIFSILLPGMYFAKEVKYQSLVQVAAAFIAVGLNFLFIPLYGLLGAAVSLMMGYLAMVILQQIWNFRRKRVYLEVQYQWNRVLWFSLIYLGYGKVMLWERNFSLLMEISLSLVAAALLLIILYTLVNTAEKRTLWAMGKQLFPKMPDRMSLKT